MPDDAIGHHDAFMEQDDLILGVQLIGKMGSPEDSDAVAGELMNMIGNRAPGRRVKANGRLVILSGRNPTWSN